VRLLVLFDVDGTLFLTDDPLAGQALRESLEERFDVQLAADAIGRVDHAAQTSLRIGRLVLESAGIRDVDSTRLAVWCPRFAERYLELLADADTSDWHAAPDAGAALGDLRAAGHRLALLTGNPEPMARARIERLGLAQFFPAGQGGFGCEGELREELIALARARAGDWPADATVEIGDTTRDASTAHAAGIHSIRVGESGLADAVARLPFSAA
jgi:phosphoglycolate phosphatase-like HAD superfamily hydrolase